MQGGNRAPKVIKAVAEGPSIGFTVGYSEVDEHPNPELNR